MTACSISDSEGLSLSPVQAYLQSSNLASQHFYRYSDCTALVNCNWSPTERFDIRCWESAYALHSLLQPPNEKTFYPEIGENGFNRDMKKVYTEEWSLASILKNYVDPRPLALHFAQIKHYDTSIQAIADFNISGLLSSHNVIAGHLHYKNYDSLIFRTSHLTLDAWKNTSDYTIPLENLTSWAFFSNRRNYLMELSNPSPEIVSLVHSRDSVDTLLRPAFQCASKLYSKRKQAFSSRFREDEFAEAVSLSSWFDDELENFDTVIKSTFADSDDIMTSLNDDEKSLILGSLNSRKIAVCVGEEIIKKQEGHEFSGTSIEIPLNRIDLKAIEIILNQLVLTDRRSANVYVHQTGRKYTPPSETATDVDKEHLSTPAKFFHLIPVDRSTTGMFEHSIFEPTSPLTLGTAAILRVPEECSLRYAVEDSEPRAVSLVNYLILTLLLNIE